MEKIQTSTIVSSEVVSGLLLIISFILALFVANIDSFSELYKNFVFLPITFSYGEVIFKSPLINLVNDGLMAFFFLLIGLELKFHLVCGEFQNRKTLILPFVAAIGGIIVPALVYLYFNYDSSTAEGWAIPIATDTAFMLGVLSFSSRSISSNLRVFIIGFSLIDDALALIILAIFYSKSSSVIAVIAMLLLISLLVVLNRLKIERIPYYICVGIVLWIVMVEANVHGTLCGVILALAIPVQVNGKLNTSFQQLENLIRPLVYYLILPLFAFINSGINFNSFSIEVLTSNITIGIILGLFVGKQLGIFLFSYVAVKQRLCSLPENVSWLQFYAIAALGGIGFTLSMFIGDLTFELEAPNYAMRAGVIIGSLLSAIFGVSILKKK